MIMAAYDIWYPYKLFLRQISRRGQWYSTSDENNKQVSGTDYQSFFGDLAAIQASQNGQFLNNLHKDLNRPDVYRIWMGPEPVLMLAHPRAVKEFWSQHNENRVERNVHLGWPLEMIMSNGVGFRSMEDRNRITKYFHQALGQNQIRHFDLELETIVTEFFHQHSSDILQSHHIKYLAHDAAIPFFLGNAGFDHIDELHVLVDRLKELMTEAFDARWMNVPIIGYYLLPSSYKLRKRICLFNKRIRHVLTKIINIYRQSSFDHDEMNVSIVASFARDPNPSITFDELADTIVEGLLAPNDGTAGTFMYTLILLSMHHEIQEKVRQEIRACPNLTLNSLKEISYLDQVLSECQRLLPIFMFNVPEFASKPMTVGGIQIPKNTMVMLDVISLNHNSDAWQPDPLSFRPERFIPPVSPQLIKAYHGFGNGHLRRCLGQYFVKNLHRLFLAHLLSRKQIRFTNDIHRIDDIERCRLPFIYVPSGTVQLEEL
ncbi:unnamed protein product [Rotaria sordida]|uniref:Cytochrome P450 n=3 Tax=Rotaria sordida TaxID=392033 RepID=A0A815FF04_9BILA|nr:unnamed protein product [Rotaria sordida]